MFSTFVKHGARAAYLETLPVVALHRRVCMRREAVRNGDPAPYLSRRLCLFQWLAASAPVLDCQTIDAPIFFHVACDDRHATRERGTRELHIVFTDRKTTSVERSPAIRGGARVSLEKRQKLTLRQQRRHASYKQRGASLTSAGRASRAVARAGARRRRAAAAARAAPSLRRASGAA